jgi:ABC-2 type transport system ATP-binding protein
VAIISKGKIIARGSPDELIERTANYLVLTLKTADGKPVEVLRRMGYEPTLDGPHTLKLRVEHTDEVRKILSALAEAGTSALGLDVRKPNLEAVFLTLTGEALREGAPAGAPQ